MTTTASEITETIDHAYKTLVDRYEAVAHHDQCSAEMSPIDLVLDPYDVDCAAHRDTVFVDELTQLVNIGRCVRIHVRLTCPFPFEFGAPGALGILKKMPRLPRQVRDELNTRTDGGVPE